MRSCSAAIALVVSGCGTNVDLLPRLADGSEAGAVALMHLPSVAAPLGAKGDLFAGDGATSISLDEGAVRPTVALIYEPNVEQLKWHVGFVGHDESGTSRVRRPTAVARRVDADSPWADATVDAASWAALPALRAVWSEDPCGCFDADGWCRPTCSDRSVVAPPEPPRPWDAPSCGSSMRVVTTTIVGERLTSCTSARAPTCAGDERATVAGTCVQVGRACDADAEGWPRALPPGTPRFVASGAAAGGDGSRARPWNLEAASASASDGDVLVLSRGEHVAQRIDRQNLVLIGLCARETRVSLDLVWGSARLEHLTLGGVATVVATPGALELRGVIVDRLLSVDGSVVVAEARVGTLTQRGSGTVSVQASELLGGLDFSGGRAILEDDVLRGMTHADRRADVVVRASALHLAPDVTAFQVDTASLTLDRVAVLGGLDGILATQGSGLDIQGSYFAGQDASMMNVRGVGTRVSIRDTVSAGSEYGLTFSTGVHAELAGVGIRDAVDRPFVMRTDAIGETLTVSITDLRTEGSLAGILVDGGDLELTRATIGANTRTGLQSTKPFSVAHILLTDVRIRGAGTAGIKLDSAVPNDVTIQLERVWIEESKGFGIQLEGAVTRLVATDLTIRSIGSLATCSMTHAALCKGIGIGLRRSTLLEPLSVERFVIEGVGYAGVVRAEDIELNMRDGAIGAAAIGVAADGAPDWRDGVTEVDISATTVFEPIDY